MLVYNAANIANHYFTAAFLEEIAEIHLEELEFHIANKKIKCLADDGSVVEPTAPNGIKLEMFVFDVFRFSSDLAVLSVLRDEEFSPLKNAPGAKDCTPESCCNDVIIPPSYFLDAIFSLEFFFSYFSYLLFTRNIWNGQERPWWEVTRWRSRPLFLMLVRDWRS